jgi:peptidoglycan/xylan/chitin deacetylase (PgdA/CDA1 family)
MRALPFLSRAQLALAKGLTYGNLKRLARGRITVSDYLASLAMAIRLPLVALGLVRDPWEQSIEQVTRIEEEFGARSTFFLMPFARQAGHVGPGRAAPENRASYYRLSDYAELVRSLVERGWEVGIHGIDCHISPQAAAAERAELAAVVGDGYRIGVRMHWLYRSPALEFNLAEAGFAYDSTLGSNNSIGFPSLPDGTRALRPFADPTTGLPIVPLAIQDVALLREDHMGLAPAQAWKAIEAVLDEAGEHHAVVTVLWHNDSFLAPRCWAGLYRRMLERARRDGAVIGRAVDVVGEGGVEARSERREARGEKREARGESREASRPGLASARPDDAPEMVAFHNRMFGAHRTPDFWHWKYRDHVPGKSVYVVARSHGNVVGTQGMIPIRLRVDGGVELTGKSENSLVDTGFRGRGLWNRMYREALAQCRDRGMTAVWGFTPVETARRGLARLGFAVHDVMVQGIAILNFGPMLKVIWNSQESTLGRLGATLAMPGAWCLSKLRNRGSKDDTEYGCGPFPAGLAAGEIAGLYEQVVRDSPDLVHLDMNEEYLRWRVLQHPRFRHELWHARRNGRLVAIALVNGNYVLRPAILELAFVEQRDAAGLLARMTEHYAASGAGALTFWANRTNRYGRMLLAAARGLGFFRRPARSSFVVKDIADGGAPKTDPGRWLLSALWFEGYAV